MLQTTTKLRKKIAENRIPIQHVPLVPLWDRLGTQFGPIKPTMFAFRGSSGSTLGVSGRSLAASGVLFRALNDVCGLLRTRVMLQAGPGPRQFRWLLKTFSLAGDLPRRLVLF